MSREQIITEQRRRYEGAIQFVKNKIRLELNPGTYRVAVLCTSHSMQQLGGIYQHVTLPNTIDL